MRTHVLVAAGVVAGVLLAPVSSASADSTVVSKAGLPSGWGWSDTRYDGRPGDSSLVHVEGPAGVPSGLGSLQLNHGEHTFKLDLYGPASGAAVADWTTFSVTYRSSQEVSVNYGVFGLDGGDQAIVWLPPTDTWSTVDLLAQQIQLVGPPHEEVHGTLSWSELVAAYPGATVGGFGFEVREPGTTNLDTVKYGVTGDVTTMNFDTDPVPVITSSTMTVTLAPGGSTPLSGRVKRPSGDAIAGLPVELWQKVWGTGTWVKSTTVTTKADGSFSTVVKPAKQTYFQWRVDEAGFAPATSATRRVDVRATLSLNLLDPTVSSSTSVVAFGGVKPTLAGATVTLHRSGSSAPLAYAKVRADATYAFAKVLGRGTWSLFVTCSATDGISAGESQRVSVTVS